MRTRSREHPPKIETPGEIQAEYLALETAAQFAFSHDTKIPYETYIRFLQGINYIKQPNPTLADVARASARIQIPEKVAEKDKALIQQAQDFFNTSPEIKRAIDYWEKHKKTLEALER